MKNITFLIALLFCVSGFSQTQIDLPIDWEGSTTNYTVIDFGHNNSSLVADPLNSSNTVLQSIKPDSAELWAGTTLSDTNGLATPIPFTASANTITVYVYSPDAGIPVRLKAEDHTDPTKSVETEALTTVSNAWDTLVFDFSNQSSGTAPINYTYTYDKLSIFYNFGTDGATAGSKTYYCDEVFFGGTASGPMVSNVTFRVNMNTYAGSFTTPEINGDFNGWCGGCNPLSDANGDGIWEVTIPLTQDSIEFKYAYDSWAGQENLTPGMSCVKTTGGFTNRFMHLNGDTILPIVCWDDCMNCAGGPYDVTFQVDMNNYSGTFTTPEVNGLFNGWCGNCSAMSDPDGDGIWAITIPLQDSTEYKFSYDNWAGQESLLAGSTCTKTTGANTNRFITITGDTVLPAVCWESCETCTSAPVSADITFKLDLSMYSGTYSTVNLNGTFNNWCGSCAQMTSPNNDDVYEITVTVPTDSIEFKYTLDGWDMQESLTEGDPCTVTKTDASGTFTNRVLVPTGDTTLPAVCWESCDICDPNGINDPTWVSHFEIQPNPNHGIFTISAAFQSSIEYRLNVIDLQGRSLMERTFYGAQIKEEIDLQNLESGIYLINIVSEQGITSKRVMITH